LSLYIQNVILFVPVGLKSKTGVIKDLTPVPGLEYELNIAIPAPERGEQDGFEPEVTLVHVLEPEVNKLVQFVGTKVVASKDSFDR
jgi:hypothetical protein